MQYTLAFDVYLMEHYYPVILEGGERRTSSAIKLVYLQACALEEAAEKAAPCGWATLEEAAGFVRDWMRRNLPRPV